jgi:thiol:disulfide interchange protein DsbD
MKFHHIDNYLSFFGYFELALPSKWGNKADSGSNIGGLIGIFFMALTLAIVSFSCTGPILGSLLAGTLGGDVSTVVILGMEFKMVATKLTAGMTGFGLALGFPFALFALFPKLLDALPQSGGWLNSVKVVLGFLEVALAIKFLSNADMVEQWGLIKRETFFVLWFIVGALTVLYLVGKIQFPHDSKLVKISKMRFGFILSFLLFTIYLIPGMFGSHLNWWEHKALSGFPPPLSYSYTYQQEEKEVFFDYWEAIEYAEKEGKAVFIDFTGWACVNCRKMEENVFPEVEDFLGEFVLCQLYVDEQTLLDSMETVIVPTSDGGTKKKTLTTVGNKWSTLQAVTYASSSQPYYVLYSPKNGLLTNPIGYTPDVSEFQKWLKCGLEEFHK